MERVERKPVSSCDYDVLVYTTQVNSAFRALWLVNSEVISPEYPDKLGYLWCHETHVLTNENACVD